MAAPEAWTMSVSILILTLNEEVNLPTCLASVGRFDDVVVLDSFSTDRTVHLAQESGARVVQRKFDNWAAHQNWALEQIPFKYPWVFYLDADERMTPELAEEIYLIAGDPRRQEAAFYCGRRNIFMGQWIKHAMPPGSIMRFFRPGFIRFERLVNPTPVIDGQHGYLRGQLLHYNFSKGLTEWIEKHNKYSLMEAIQGLKERDTGSPDADSVFSRDPAVRRKALKALSVSMPLRPLLKFLYLYIANRGFLDGRAGLTYCVLQSIYEYMIVIKMQEIQRRSKGLPI
jgi:glycosyltransferase involved in cell wall biosynthesis